MTNPDPKPIMPPCIHREIALILGKLSELEKILTDGTITLCGRTITVDQQTLNQFKQDRTELVTRLRTKAEALST